jgi:hypothetical protein
MRDNPWLRWLLIAVVVLLLILLLAWMFGAFGGGEEEAGATTTTAAETSTSASGETTTTTVAGTTTTAGETTTTSEETTTTDETTTTLARVEPMVLADNGIGGVDFGATPEETIDYATAFLGPPDNDTGWIDALSSPYGVCPEPEVRGVEWGTSAGGSGPGFTLLFTKADTTHGSGEHFFGYYFFGGDIPLTTAEGITVGSTNFELQASIPSAVIDEDPFDPSAGAWMSDVDPDDMNLLWGYSTSVAPDGLIETVNGGSTCGE